MGIFRKVGDWLTEKSDHFIRGESEMPNGYYGSREAEQAYSTMGTQQVPDGESGAPEKMAQRPVNEAFASNGDVYGGRVPYRSKYDREQEAQFQQTDRMPVMHIPSAQAQDMQMNTQQPMNAQVKAQSMGMPQQMGTVVPQSQPMPAQMNMAQTTGYGQGYQQPVNNVVPFPGMQRTTDGSVYAHVEYIVLLRSRNECKDVITYIKLNASVFLNMEFIASDNERQRCVDMLSGAAYTLGCALNKISPRGIYLISSPSVRVVLDPAMQKFATAPEAQGFVRQRYENDGYQQGGYQVRPEPMQELPRQQPMTGFSSGSPTTRFRAQGTQRSQSINFGSMMAGNATGAYQPVNATMAGSATGRFSIGPQ